MVQELEKNGIAILREQKARAGAYGQEERAILVAGFVSPFWKLLEKDMDKAVASCLKELKTCTDLPRIMQLQGEIAALETLLNTRNLLSAPPQKSPVPSLQFETE